MFQVIFYDSFDNRTGMKVNFFKFTLYLGEQYIFYLFPFDITSSIHWNKCYGYTIQSESINVSHKLHFPSLLMNSKK